MQHYGDERDFQVHFALLRRDVGELDQLGRWRRAYLGRYLRFQPSEVDAMSVRESWSYVKLVGELVEKERGAATTAIENTD